MLDKITIKGARQHNLKNISLEIPKNKFTVITGVSGSGKSSLAFDTLYAEGQRRYVESLSAYARQFLGVMDKPDVDLIEGLSPSISIDQKTVSHNPRSTVGTITEIYDYLRVLYARIGHPHCPDCGREIVKLSHDEMVDKIVLQISEVVKSDKIKPHTFQLYSPIVRQKKGEFKDLFTNLLVKGFKSVRIDGKNFEVSTEISLLKTNKHSIDVLIDTVSIQNKNMSDIEFIKNLKTRLNTAVQQSVDLSDGLVLFNERLLSEKFSCPVCNISLPEIEPRMFSFNSPIGACTLCKGIGVIFKVDPDLLLNKKLSILEGGIMPFSKFFFQETWYIRLLKQVAEDEKIDMKTPLEKIQKEKIDILLYGTDKIYDVEGKNRFGRDNVIHEKFDGLIKELEKRYFESSGDYSGFEIQKYMREELCTSCKGKKLKPEVLAITIDTYSITKISELSVVYMFRYFKNDLTTKLSEYEMKIAVSVIKEICERLNFLINVGLSYLTIARTAKTLSGGELQRIRLASQIGTGLTGVLYVLDEPSIGLHPKDVSALISTLQKLKDLGNTLVIVEHDKETIESADHLIELGPKAGRHGGKIMFEGNLMEIMKSKTSLTGSYLSGSKSIELRQQPFEKNKGTISLKKASQFNLKKVDVEFPLGNLICVTGVSGSGKSTLVVETLYLALKYYLEGHVHEQMGDFYRLDGYHYIDRVYLVDQSPIGRTPRSNPATYVGFFDDIRELFASTVEAKSRGFQKGRFSFNIKGGRCEKCQGAGLIKIEMQFLPDVYITCDICNGKRYNKETLEVLFKEKTIYDVLQMTVEDGLEFFANHHHIFTKLVFLQKVGLGYIQLGQPAPTFSGGEAQRMKLANELSRKETGKTLYILDEPTTGLHFFDIQKLLDTLQELTSRGNTVIVIEHNLDVIKNCQYIIDLGPDGGDAGGAVVFQGLVKDIYKNKNSYTADYLRKAL